MPETQTVFPKSFAEQIFDSLQERSIQILCYSDLNYKESQVGSKHRYWDEYVRFRFGRSNIITIPLALFNLLFLRMGSHYSLERFRLYRRVLKFIYKNSKVPTVILQHDADSLPERTIDMMKRERNRGLRSSCYFFAHHAEGEDYELDIKTLQELESAGFEIGYHQNAYERAGYDQKIAFEIVESDLNWLEKYFQIRSFVPHGGKPSADGLNNIALPHDGRLQSLFWAYNGKCILKEYIWSDGGIHHRTPENPLDFIAKLTNGSRATMLMHPQYYGDKLREDWRKLPISKESWWKELWGF